MSVNFPTIPPKTLAKTISASDMTLKPSDILGFDGVAITSASLNDTWYCALKNPSGTKLEIMKLDPTTVANYDTTGITVLKRGLSFYGAETEVSGNKLTWVKNETIINFGTDLPQIWQWFKNYIDGIAIAGSPDATASTKGIVKMSTAPASSSNPIAVGDNDPRVPTQGENDALAGNDGTPSSSNKYVTESGLSAVYSFGNGSDGDVTISSPTTLTRDMYYNNLTVNDTLNTANFRIFVKGTLSGSGTIQANGGNGGNGSAPTAGTAGVAVTSGYFTTLPGYAGGAGDISAGGSSGTSGGASTPSIGVVGVAGGRGGDGSTNSGGSGGSAGTLTAVIQKFGILRWLTVSGIDLSASAVLSKLTGSSGSGGGGGARVASTTANGGGGGGSGAPGGIVFILAKIWAGTMTLKAIGGNGGNGGTGTVSGTPAAAGGGGGGAGGAGGVVVVIYNTKTWTGSYVLTGGTGGTGGAGAHTGGYTHTDGANGTAGTTGTSIEVNIISLI